jgi:hypothetical protein
MVVGLRNIAGSIPEGLFYLTSLTRLHLDDNRLEGPLPQNLECVSRGLPCT